MNVETLELMEETGKWRTRKLRYISGSWPLVMAELPEFELVPFRMGEGEPENPFLKTVLRHPMSAAERPVPVGTVSPNYGMVPHKAVAEQCLQGIVKAGVPVDQLRFEVGLSELGEWMNLRIYFPERFNGTFRDNHDMGLRLECYNSVEGSSRLMLLLGWLRFVCGNGMVIGETVVDLRTVHTGKIDLDLQSIPEMIQEGLLQAAEDKARMNSWEEKALDNTRLAPWADGAVAPAWNALSASKVLHICGTGRDGEWIPFSKGMPSEKPMKPLAPVPGAPAKAQNFFDVSQALSWVATQRHDPEQRVQWQKQIPSLIAKLEA